MLASRPSRCRPDIGEHTAEIRDSSTSGADQFPTPVVLNCGKQISLSDEYSAPGTADQPNNCGENNSGHRDRWCTSARIVKICEDDQHRDEVGEECRRPIQEISERAAMSLSPI
jgi:hypothetical protein